MRFVAVCGVAALAVLNANAADFTFDGAQTFLKTYCAACHSGKSPAAGFNISQTPPQTSLADQAERWSHIANRVTNGEMPPRGLPAPPVDDRENFVHWISDSLHTAACSKGVSAARFPIRRLNKDQYTATIRELLDVHVDVGHDLPQDGAGGQGFDNAAEVLFLSPVLAEKYMDAAKNSLDFAVLDSRARKRIGIVEPAAGSAETKAARKLLVDFLPRAWRRPVTEREADLYLNLFRQARKKRQTYDQSVVYMLRGVLMSPQFLFRAEGEPMSTDYALASRLSYFLWNSMPDEMLFDLAGMGKLHEPSVLEEEVGRMLRSPKATSFIESFVTQWLGTRELGREFVPDAKLFPEYAENIELQGDIRFQPIVFFHTLVANDLPLTDLIDSNWTIATRTLAKVYFPDIKIRKDNAAQPHRIELPPGSNRGGLLGMPAILAVSSYPYRTSPVLRGKWVLDSMLGTPPLPPPPNVPALEEHKGAAPKTMRERLAQHRANPVCASCHSRIDPIGFALENYDAIGRWRAEDAGKPIDAVGELPDGTKFNGPEELKKILMAKKDLFIRNLTTRMLGYALGRGLTREDTCAVDGILDQLAANGYRAQTLIRAIVMSPAFTGAGSGPSPVMPHRDATPSQIAANQTATREAKTNE
jgi:hypothetical protein